MPTLGQFSNSGWVDRQSGAPLTNGADSERARLFGSADDRGPAAQVPGSLVESAGRPESGVHSTRRLGSPQHLAALDHGSLACIVATNSSGCEELPRSIVTVQSAPSDPFVGHIVHDRYEIVRLIGAGGMGLVYEARHVLLGRRFAFKTQPALLARESVERFHREARAAAAVGNEHIVDVVDMGRLQSGAYFMVMEYLDGVELNEAALSGKVMSVRRAVHIVSQICEALASVHQAGIVHRDLKPENVFLVERKGDSDFVKVLDFGVCRVRDDEDRLTRSGDIVGTPHYMAPEQVTGCKDVDHRADIYAIGAILYYLLTQSPPFDAEALPQLFVNIHREPAPSLRTVRPGVPEALDAVVQRLLQKAPDDRYASCDEVRLALSPFLTFDEPDSEPVLVVSADEDITSEGYSETVADTPAPMGGTLVSPGANQPSTPAERRLSSPLARGLVAAGVLVPCLVVAAAAVVPDPAVSERATPRAAAFEAPPLQAESFEPPKGDRSGQQVAKNPAPARPRPAFNPPTTRANTADNERRSPAPRPSRAIEPRARAGQPAPEPAPSQKPASAPRPAPASGIPPAAASEQGATTQPTPAPADKPAASPDLGKLELRRVPL